MKPKEKVSNFSEMMDREFRDIQEKRVRDICKLDIDDEMRKLVYKYYQRGIKDDQWIAKKIDDSMYTNNKKEK